MIIVTYTMKIYFLSKRENLKDIYNMTFFENSAFLSNKFGFGSFDHLNQQTVPF